MSQTTKRVKPSQEKELSQDPRRLRRMRRAAGLTLREAAAKAECSFTHLSDLENGSHSARPGTLAALAAAYDCRIIDLMPREPNGAAA